jgi:hypothetical protein
VAQPGEELVPLLAAQPTRRRRGCCSMGPTSRSVGSLGAGRQELRSQLGELVVAEHHSLSPTSEPRAAAPDGDSIPDVVTEIAGTVQESLRIFRPPAAQGRATLAIGGERLAIESALSTRRTRWKTSVARPTSAGAGVR